MPLTKGQTFQDVNQAALTVLGQPSRTELDTLFGQIDQAFDLPVRLRASSTPDSILHLSPAPTFDGDTGAKSLTAVGGLVPSFAAATIDFQAQTTSGGTVNITFPASTVGFFRRCVFTIDNTNSVTATFSSESVTVGALQNAGGLFPANSISLGWIDLEATDVLGKFKTAGSASNIIENSVGGIARIVRVVGGSGSSSGASSSMPWVAQEAAIGNASNTVTVTFTTPQNDTSYIILPQLVNTVDVSPRFLQVESTVKTVNGFTATLSDTTDSINYRLAYIVPLKAFQMAEKAVGNASSSVTATLAFPQATSSYGVVGILQNVVDASPQFQPLTITTTSTTNVVANWSGPTLSGNYKFVYLLNATGQAPVSITSTSVTVTLPIDYGNTNYAIFGVMQNTTDSLPQYQPLLVSAKTNTTFTMKWNANTLTANNLLTYYALSFSS